MGSDRSLIPETVAADDPFWNLLPEVESPTHARAVTAAVARELADRMGVRHPRAYADVAEVHEGPWSRRLTELSSSVGGPELIGQVWEYLLAPADRHGRGAHFTPTAVAHAVTALALDQRGAGALPESTTPTVWDPAAGGGAFLLAACRQLAAAGHDTLDLVERCYASDIDDGALDACDAALELWSGGRARPHRACIDALLESVDGWPTAFDLIVGNPPFLGQLATSTARRGDRASRLRERYAEVSMAYLDDAGLFLHMAQQRIARDGLVALVLPASLLGASDASAVRRSIEANGSLAALWLESEQSFSASVDVVAVVVDRSANRITRVVSEHGSQTVPTPPARSWAPLLAAADGVPLVDLDETDTIGNHASVTAGFRQHFYGIQGAVSEAEGGDSSRLLTAGAIDPLKERWGSAPITFNGKRWFRPVLHIDRIEDPAVADWFRSRSVPKLLLASQTAVIEAIVDLDGTRLPSVPVLSLEAEDPDRLWHLAAALTAPAVSARLVSLAAGTGLSRRAIRVRAAELLRVPLPNRALEWDRGAAAARTAQAAAEADDDRGYVDALRVLGRSMDAAYGVGPEVGVWWWERLRLPSGLEEEAY